MFVENVYEHLFCISVSVQRSVCFVFKGTTLVFFFCLLNLDSAFFTLYVSLQLEIQLSRYLVAGYQLTLLSSAFSSSVYWHFLTTDLYF